MVGWHHRLNGQESEQTRKQRAPGDINGKESAGQSERHKRLRFDPWVGKIPWSRKWQPTPVFLPGWYHRELLVVGKDPTYLASEVGQQCDGKREKLEEN